MEGSRTLRACCKETCLDLTTAEGRSWKGRRFKPTRGRRTEMRMSGRGGSGIFIIIFTEGRRGALPGCTPSTGAKARRREAKELGGEEVAAGWMNASATLSSWTCGNVHNAALGHSNLDVTASGAGAASLSRRSGYRKDGKQHSCPQSRPLAKAATGPRCRQQSLWEESEVEAKKKEELVSTAMEIGKLVGRKRRGRKWKSE